MKYSKLMSAMLATLVFSGCGGSSSSGGNDEVKKAPTLKGVFTDSAVAGLRYETPTQSGVTDANGNYNYQQGEAVTFYVGNQKLASLPAKGTVTPVDFDSTTNLAQLLQSLDEDGNPDNGLMITESVANNLQPIDLNAVDFDQKLETEVARLKTEMPSSNIQYVSGTDALKHLDKNPAFAAEGGLFAMNKKKLQENAAALKQDSDKTKLAYALELAGVENVDPKQDYSDFVDATGGTVDLEAAQAKIAAKNALSDMELSNQEMVTHLRVLFGDDLPDYANYKALQKLTDDGSFDIDYAEQNVSMVKTTAEESQAILVAQKQTADADQATDESAIKNAMQGLGFDLMDQLSYAPILKDVTVADGETVTMAQVDTAVKAKIQQIEEAYKAIAGYGEKQNVDYDAFVVITDNEVDAASTETNFTNLNTLVDQAIAYKVDATQPEVATVNTALMDLGWSDIMTGQDYRMLVYKQVNTDGIPKESMQDMITAVLRLNAFKMFQDDIDSEADNIPAKYRGIAFTDLMTYQTPENLIALLKQARFDVPMEGMDYKDDVLNQRNYQQEAVKEPRFYKKNLLSNTADNNYLNIAQTQDAINNRATSGVKTIKVERGTGYAIYTNAIIRNDGSIVVWEANARKVINNAEGDSAATKLYGNNSFFIAMREDGSAIRFDRTNSEVLSQINKDVKVKQMAIGSKSMAALLENGKIVEIGASSETLVAFESDYSIEATAVYAAASNFSAVREDGTVYFWGPDIIQSGPDVDEGDVTPDVNMLEEQVPGRNGSDESEMMDTIVMTSGAFIGKLKNGRVLTWGSHSSMNGSTMSIDTSSAISDVDAIKDNPVVSVTANNKAAAALRQDGSIVVWGDNLHGGTLTKSSFIIPDDRKGSYDRDGDGVVDETTGSYNCYLFYGNCDYDPDKVFDYTNPYTGQPQVGGSIPTALEQTRYLPNDSALVDATNKRMLNTSAGKYTKIIANKNSFIAIREDGTYLSWGGNPKQ